MKTRKREIAKAGVFGSIENPTVVKEADLQEIAETFKEIKKAPIKLGSHWTEDRPRLGNVIAVEYDAKNKTLYGTIEEQDVLAKAVDEDGYYPDVSIGAKQRASDGKYYLHHLAYLGDEPPAIKDLEQKIAEDMKSAEEQTNKEELAASDKDFIAYPGTNAKQLYLSDTETNKGNEILDPAEPSGMNMSDGSSAKSGKEGQSMTAEEIEAMQKENARLKAENEAKDKMLSDSLASEHAREKEALRKAAEGKVTQPQMESLMALADSFESGKTIELSDSEGNKKAEHPLTVLAGIFDSIKPKVEEGAINLSDSGETENVEPLNFSAI